MWFIVTQRENDTNPDLQFACKFSFNKEANSKTSLQVAHLRTLEKQWSPVWQKRCNLFYLLRYLAVGCSNKSPSVVDVTPDHIVSEVWFQHQKLRINLELKSRREITINLYIPTNSKTELITVTYKSFVCTVHLGQIKCAWKMDNAMVQKPLPLSNEVLQQKELDIMLKTALLNNYFITQINLFCCLMWNVTLCWPQPHSTPTFSM